MKEAMLWEASSGIKLKKLFAFLISPNSDYKRYLVAVNCGALLKSIDSKLGGLKPSEGGESIGSEPIANESISADSMGNESINSM